MAGSENLYAAQLISKLEETLCELKRVYSIEQVMSCTEAAMYLGVTNSTISRYLALGKLHKVKRGVRVGILASELARLKKA